MSSRSTSNITPENKLNNLVKICESLIKDALYKNIFPGGVLNIYYSGNTVYYKGFGRFDYNENSKKVKKYTIYDTASLTKVMAVVPAVMILHDKGQIDIEEKVSYYIPEFNRENKNKIRIKHLLSHSSGLPSYREYFRKSKLKQDVINHILNEPLEYKTNSDYSDLGFILLGYIIERITNSSLADFCEKNIFKPLNMNSTFYRPPRELWEKIPPTEKCSWRKKTIQGEVHDENSYAMGGIAGHAGLFSNAGNIAKYCRMILDEGVYKGKQIIKRETIKKFTTRVEGIKNCKWGLGWRMFMGKDDVIGNTLSPESFGHLGYTGTSLWIDPEKNLFAILLTNRVHPTRENKKITAFRPLLHDEIWRFFKA
ncbi:serine hydrolase [bacterium]|nr:serine hydrolase [bacterium]